MIEEKKISEIGDFLSQELQGKLPGTKAHKKMIPVFPDNTPEYFNYNQKLREAAVLIPLIVEKDSIKTVFIERTPDAGPHSGQIAFPGGKREGFDSDLVETALREAKEEVGIKLSRKDYIGSLTPVQIPISRFSVEPVICVTDKIMEFVKQEAEVSTIFTVDLLELFDTEDVRLVKARDIMINAPSFKFENQIVWGATAMVLKELKNVISTFLGH